jgi:bacterioferritin-associated ferredoxin
MEENKDRIICCCYGVKESTIRDAILKYSIKEIEEVMEACDAGTGCGCCHLLIEDLIQEYNG